MAIHVPCSSKKMGVADAFQTVASKCAHEVTNTGVPCCGMHPASRGRVRVAPGLG